MVHSNTHRTDGGACANKQRIERVPHTREVMRSTIQKSTTSRRVRWYSKHLYRQCNVGLAELNDCSEHRAPAHVILDRHTLRWM
jgi:hypothetical protein